MLACLVGVACAGAVLGNWSGSLEADEVGILREKLGKDAGFDGLVRFTSGMRTLHPKAAIKNPQNERTRLRGWSVTRDRPCDVDPAGLQWKALNWMFAEGVSDDERWRRARVFVTNFTSVSSEVVGTEAFEGRYERVAKAGISINGRVVKAEPFEVAEAVIEEAMNGEMAKQLDLSAEWTERLHYTDVLRATRLFMAAPHRKCAVRNPGADKRFRLSDQVDIDDFSIDKVREPLMQMHYFPRLGDAGAVPLLNRLLDELAFPMALELSVFPIANLNRRGERRALFAFLQVKAEFSGREAIRYLIKGASMGYKAAYESYKISPKWKNLERLMFPETDHFVTSAVLTDYFVQRNITETTLLLNGIPFVGPDIHDDLKEYWNLVNDEMKVMAKKGLLTNLSNWTSVIENYSVPISTMNDMKRIREAKYLNMHTEAVPEQLTMLRKIEASECLYSVGDPLVYVVVFGDGNFTDLVTSRNWTVPFAVKHVKEPLVKGVKVLIGGVCLDHIPDVSELSCLLHFVHQSFLMDTNLTDLSQMQRLYWQLWRGSMAERQVRRTGHMTFDENYTISIGQGVIPCEVTCNMLEVDSRKVISIFDDLVALGVVSLKFEALFPTGALAKVPDHLNQEFIPMYATDKDISDDPSYEYHFPVGWAVQREGDSWIVTSVTAIGVTAPHHYFSVGKESRMSLEDGLFALFLPIGVHQSRGLRQQRVVVDSLSCAHMGRFVPGRSVPCAAAKPAELNVFSFVAGKEYEDQVRVMMRTLTNHSKVPVKFWIIGHLHTELSSEYNVVWLPLVLPGVLVNPISPIQALKLAKLLNMDLYFQPEVRSVLFCDPGTVWLGDSSRFLRLDMRNASLALPDISKRNKADKHLFFMQEEMIRERLFRPYHSSALFFVNLETWRNQRGREVIKGLYEKLSVGRRFVMIDDELVNMAQGIIQVITLPETTSFCDKYSDTRLRNASLSISLCSTTSAEHLPVSWETLVEEL